MKTLDLDLAPVVSSLTLSVRITGRRRFAMRCWIAGRIMAIAALVIGTKLDLTADLTSGADSAI
jgi:hypothetical protein